MNKSEDYERTNIVLDAIDGMDYEQYCCLVAYLLATGHGNSTTFEKDVTTQMELLGYIAGERTASCTH